jgi:ribosomal protein S18 acetylase RimI-like enzyme
MEIREAHLSDAEELLKLFQCLDSDTEFMLFESDERATSVDEQVDILSGFSNDISRAMMVAFANGIAGFCVLINGRQRRTKHVASLVIGVKKSQWGENIASKIMEFAITKSNANGTKRIELTVHKSNEATINLYKKHGFKIEGERVSSINLKGKLVNEYYMARV